MIPVSRVSVIVPTRNRPDALRRLLDSLLDTDIVFEVVVVDDGSQPIAAATNPKVRLIRNEVPRLVSASRNRGAREASGDLLLFIDDDCVVAPGAVQALAKAFEREHALGLAGPLICYLSRPTVVWCAGAALTRWSGRTVFRGRGGDVAVVRSLGGSCESFPSCFAMLRDVFEEAGGFDEVNFPAHMGEGEIAERIRRRSYKTELVPEALIWHDIDPDAPFARALHLSTTGAFDVARSRGLYVRQYSPDTATKVARLLFWILALVPVYIYAMLFSRWARFGTRILAIGPFLRGTWHGLIDPWQQAIPRA